MFITIISNSMLPLSPSSNHHHRIIKKKNGTAVRSVLVTTNISTAGTENTVTVLVLDGVHSASHNSAGLVGRCSRLELLRRLDEFTSNSCVESAGRFRRAEASKTAQNELLCASVNPEMTAYQH